MNSNILKSFFAISISLILPSCTQNNNIPQNVKIPIIESVNNEIDDAASEEGKVNIKNSPYYKIIDFYNSSPTSTLVKLKHFKTYQQTSSWSCGAACVLMAINHLGITNFSENDLVKQMDIRSPENPKDDGSYGASTESIVKFLKNLGLTVTSSFDTQDENGMSFQSVKQLANFITTKINNNSVIMVENVEFGGHWRVIVGYDDMGNKEDTSTHVIVYADPCDITDHNQDGYTIGSAERLFDSWFDNHVMPKNQKIQQYVCVSKPKASTNAKH